MKLQDRPTIAVSLTPFMVRRFMFWIPDLHGFSGLEFSPDPGEIRAPRPTLMKLRAHLRYENGSGPWTSSDKNGLRGLAGRITRATGALP